jgi:hypothetical protein
VSACEDFCPSAAPTLSALTLGFTPLIAFFLTFGEWRPIKALSRASDGLQKSSDLLEAVEVFGPGLWLSLVAPKFRD